MTEDGDIFVVVVFFFYNDNAQIYVVWYLKIDLYETTNTAQCES